MNVANRIKKYTKVVISRLFTEVDVVTVATSTSVKSQKITTLIEIIQIV